MYHTIMDVYTTALLLTKPSSDNNSGCSHGFRAGTSLPLAQSAPTVSHDTTRLCQIVITLWDCHIYTDAVRALSWIFSMHFLLSDGGSPRLVKKTEVELAIKPLHLTLIGNTFVIQPFLTHCSLHMLQLLQDIICFLLSLLYGHVLKISLILYIIIIHIYIYIYIYILGIHTTMDNT